MHMNMKMHNILNSISDWYNNSGGDFDVLEMIENARKQCGLDSSEVDYLKSEMSSAIRSQKHERGESAW